MACTRGERRGGGGRGGRGSGGVCHLDVGDAERMKSFFLLIDTSLVVPMLNNLDNAREHRENGENIL